jgi:hypothetical protein
MRSLMLILIFFLLSLSFLVDMASTCIHYSTSQTQKLREACICTSFEFSITSPRRSSPQPDSRPPAVPFPGPVPYSQTSIISTKTLECTKCPQVSNPPKHIAPEAPLSHVGPIEIFRDPRYHTLHVPIPTRTPTAKQSLDDRKPRKKKKAQPPVAHWMPRGWSGAEVAHWMPRRRRRREIALGRPKTRTGMVTTSR